MRSVLLEEMKRYEQVLLRGDDDLGHAHCGSLLSFWEPFKRPLRALSSSQELVHPVLRTMYDNDHPIVQAML